MAEEETPCGKIDPFDGLPCILPKGHETVDGWDGPHCFLKKTVTMNAYFSADGSYLGSEPSE